MAAWSKEQKQAAIRLLRAHDFVGGQDNGPAIADALVALEAESEAALLWVHGPQPVSFQGGAARLEQAGNRLSRLPRVSLYTGAERAAAGCSMGVGGTQPAGNGFAGQ